MPKRMVDTDLWNDEDIIDNFTAEDKYFWLYLLTNPHNSICGVMKLSLSVVARDMGYAKECVRNLLYRFENVHKMIYLDTKTNELVILNWGKYNWTKSPKIATTVRNACQKVKSATIREIVEQKVFDIMNSENVENSEGNVENSAQNVENYVEKPKTDTLSIPYRYPTDTNTNTNTHKIIITTNNNTKIVSYIPPDCEIAKEIKRLFTEQGARISNMHEDFIAYNNARGWLGLGGESVLDNLERYVNKWKQKGIGNDTEYLC